MTTVGGPGYKWRGQFTRMIRRGGIDCVTMPRRDSFILIPVVVQKDSMYQITLRARNNGGNGLVKVELIGHNLNIFEEIYIVSPDFNEFSVNIIIKNTETTNANLKISRTKKGTGNILVEKVSHIRKNIPKTDAEIAQEAKRKKHQQALTRQQQIGSEQIKLNKLNRQKKLDAILASRGDQVGKSLFIGGRGYRWKGKSIRVTNKHGNSVNMPKSNSMILAPIKINSNTLYRVTISASKTGSSGNGSILVNFFGGRDFDGPHQSVNISGDGLQDYVLDMSTPTFPPNIPIYLRMWRNEGSTGNLFIKDISCTYTVGLPGSTKKPRLRPRVHANQPRRKTNKGRENNIMKFKPYEISKKAIREDINKSLIISADQVPKVSIITPTRNGLDLIKKCYTALDKNTAYPNWEWIVGDSNSVDGTAEYFDTLKDERVKLIKRGTTDGSFSSINNELVKQATGEYYLFLNDDTEPQEFWLYEMMSKIHRHNNIGIVGARLMYSEHKIQHAGITFTPQGPGNMGKSVLRGFPKDFQFKDRFYQAVSAACLLMRKKDFDAVKGFDPIYHFCYEDVDLCLKVNKNLNKKVLYAANAVVFHAESATQKKYGTAGDLQRKGISEFKKRWMSKVEKDFGRYRTVADANVYNVDVSFVTCINNLTQYRNYVVGSLFMNTTKRNYEIIPIMNIGNPYSAAEALNIGIEKARGNIVVLCHQDVLFYNNWVDLLFKRIGEVEEKNKRWGVIGTAGITVKDDTLGVVHNLKGRAQWRSSKGATVYPVQTLDEHCMVIKKNSGLRFDARTFSGFHFYGADICLNALSKKMQNYGILCPLVHDSASGSIASGKQEFMKFLNALRIKWQKRFNHIRTPTSLIRKKRVKTFIKFKN